MSSLLLKHTAAFPIREPIRGINLVLIRRVASAHSGRSLTFGQFHLPSDERVAVSKGFGPRNVHHSSFMGEHKRARCAHRIREARASRRNGSSKLNCQGVNSGEADRRILRRRLEQCVWQQQFHGEQITQPLDQRSTRRPWLCDRDQSVA